MGDGRHVDGFTAKHLKKDERIVVWADGYIGKAMGSGKDKQHNGVLIVTSQRVAFYRNGIFGEVLETMLLGQITSIERKSTLGLRVLRLHTSHDDLEFKTFDKAGDQSAHDAIEAWRSEHASKGASAVEPANPLAQLKQLGELKDAGVITAQEFEAKKAEILRRV